MHYPQEDCMFDPLVLRIPLCFPILPHRLLQPPFICTFMHVLHSANASVLMATQPSSTSTRAKPLTTTTSARYALSFYVNTSVSLPPFHQAATTLLCSRASLDMRSVGLGVRRHPTWCRSSRIPLPQPHHHHQPRPNGATVCLMSFI